MLAILNSSLSAMEEGGVRRTDTAAGVLEVVYKFVSEGFSINRLSAVAFT